MIYEIYKKTLSGLFTLDKSPGYAGGSNLIDENEFKYYIVGKSNFGDCPRENFSTCYYVPTDTVEDDENKLLSLNFSCNIQKESNLENTRGFVYVMQR